MSTLLTAHDLSKTYVSHTLFQGVGMRLVEGDRLGIIGPNGAGKSTLLKIMAGLETPDHGEVVRRRGLRMVYVPQDDVFPDGITPQAAVVARLDAEAGTHRMDADTRATIMLSKLGFADVEQPVQTLSGGWRKRLSMACALALEPDALLLDEPTNHLDMDGIRWLEQLTQQSRVAMAFVTHDRRFLENAATRIIELSTAYPSGTLEVQGNYTEFVRRKEEFLDGQAAAQQSLANAVRRDTAWLRQGVQARRTRNKTQVVATQERQAQLKAIAGRNDAPNRTSAIDFQSTDRQTRKLLTMTSVAKSLGGKKLFDSVDLTLSPGCCFGLLGPNGSGKSSLLRLMAGDLMPDSGTINRANDLRIVTFSQHRHELVGTQTLQEALCPVGDMVDYLGKPMHISGWAKKFLFNPSQLSTMVGNLSGGERARVFIARLMLEPADVLLLDEPTNDLDIPSLEVLEQALLEFPGAIVLISHDRFLLERVSTEFLALDARGGAAEFASMDQWHAAARRAEAEASKANGKLGESAPKKSDTSPSGTSSKPKRLNFKQQREADGMEAAIMAAEEELQSLESLANESKVIADHSKLTETYGKLYEAQLRVQQLYERWAELEAMQKG